MTVSKDIEAQMLRLYHAEKWPIGTIASQLDTHHSVVQRVLQQDGMPAEKTMLRRSIADPFVPFIQDTLKKYPKLTASCVYEMVKGCGYRGAERHFRSIVARYRPRPAPEAYLRLRTLPGEQGQVDWGYQVRQRRKEASGVRPDAFLVSTDLPAILSGMIDAVLSAWTRGCV